MIKPICAKCKKEIIDLIVCSGRNAYHRECFYSLPIGQKIKAETQKWIEKEQQEHERARKNKKFKNLKN